MSDIGKHAPVTSPTYPEPNTTIFMNPPQDLRWPQQRDYRANYREGPYRSNRPAYPLARQSGPQIVQQAGTTRNLSRIGLEGQPAMCLLAMRAHVARDGLSVMRTAFFTIASWNYLFFARAWAESVHAAHPDADVILFLADVERPDFAAGPLFDTVIPVLTLDIAEPLSRLFRYNAMELNTSLKPAAFLELFTRGYSRAIYLDSDVLLYAPITKVTDALDQERTR